MSWVEVIRLRIPPRGRSEVLKELEVLLGNSHKAPDAPTEITTFLGLQPAGDIALVLVWPDEVLDTRPSRLGLSISADLKKYGLVNNSAWIEPAALSRDLGTTKKGE